MSDPLPQYPLSSTRADAAATRPNRTRRTLAVAAIGAVAAVGLTACGPGRSVEAYCGVMAEHKDRFVSATQDVGSADPISGLTSLVSALGDLNSMWEEAAKVAPEEIQTDVETVRDAWASQKETAEKMAENPLKGIASGLMTGLTSAAATQRVDEYTAAQCPDVGGMFLAGAGTTPSDTSIDGTSTDGTPGDLPGTDMEPAYEPPQDPVPSADRTWYPFGPAWSADAYDGGVLTEPSLFFVPEVGEVSVSAADLFGSEEIVDEQYRYFPDGAEPRLAGVITERIPGSGLEPEGYVTSVVTVDLSSGFAEVTARIDGEKAAAEPYVLLVGTAGADIVVVEDHHWGSDEDDSGTWDDGDGVDLIAYDLTTGEQAWHQASANLQRHGALGSGWTTSPAWDGTGGCTNRPYNEDGTIRPVTYAWTDLSTGAAAFEMPLMVDGEDGVVCRDITDSLSPRFSMVERWNRDLFETEGVYVLDHEARETLPVPGEIAAADPVGTAGYLDAGESRTDEEAPRDLVVLDLSTGDELYRMEEDRAFALDLTVEAIFDGILYLTTTDDHVALDVTTGEELGYWSVYPMSRVGEHTLFNDGTLEKDWSFTAG